MRVKYHTFGCKANQYDTERMRQALEARGASTVDRSEDAEVWVVNTCTVTNQADADARRFIRRIHREHPTAQIVVAGCSAALKAELYGAMPGVAHVEPGHSAEGLATVASQWVAESARAAATTIADPLGLVQITLSKSVEHTDFEAIGGELLRKRRGRTRGWLKVQDGCDRKCAFCATRLARGASRSRPVAEILAEAEMLAEHHPEIVITGIHIGHYGVDLEGAEATTLARLVERLLETLPTTRLRLGSIEATEVDDRLLGLLSGSQTRLAAHLHMPLQSGADPVLRRMRRWHTREAYRTRALQIASAVPRLGLGADVITGFPGETADDHSRTRDLIDELPFTYLHVFPYSPRDNTVAASLPDPVPQRVAGERARELRDLAQQKGRRYLESRIGEWVEVVPEGGGFGLTEDYLRVGVRPGAGEDSSLQKSSLVRAALQRDAEGPYIEVGSNRAAAGVRSLRPSRH